MRFRRLARMLSKLPQPGSAMSLTSLWHDADAIKPVARSQRVESGGGVADADYIAGESGPVGRGEVRIELHAVSHVRHGRPGQPEVGPGNRGRQQHWLRNGGEDIRDANNDRGWGVAQLHRQVVRRI